MSLGVALIGSGIFAREEHLPAILQAPQLILRAIYSRSLANAEALSSGIQDLNLYADNAREGQSYLDLLKRPDIQAVIIALPITVQPTYIKAALSAGKHVLSEKPIAQDMANAHTLLDWYHSSVDTKNVTWAVAENYRYLDSLLYAREEIEKMGRVLNIRIKKFSNVHPGGKYFETPWRKTPAYQGGFLLDGGVHFVAAARLLLGETDPIVRLSAQTALLQPHLPPLDTLDAVLKTKSGITGSFSLSFGTTFSGHEYAVACEKGSLVISNGKVIVREGEEKDGKQRVREFPEEGSGVKQEVKAWAEGLTAGAQDRRQSPEEALRDLEVLEKMLLSGEADGVPQDISL